MPLGRVAYSGGSPLALEVLGSFSIGRSMPEWKCQSQKLRTIPRHEIHKKLRISFDGLSDDREKDIFLDKSLFKSVVENHESIPKTRITKFEKDSCFKNKT